MRAHRSDLPVPPVQMDNLALLVPMALKDPLVRLAPVFSRLLSTMTVS